ncbi:hypothetical protein MP228_009981 [Amoeboaphelidium protococcarum]|nr:hypothetical protein MP228_009981 [Amoeboaphelidium protococcarum]
MTGIEDIQLPRASLIKLVKRNLPPNVFLSKDAATAILKATTMFTTYLTVTAADLDGKKQLTSEDVFKAMDDLDMEELLPRSIELFKSFRKLQKMRRDSWRSNTLSRKMEQQSQSQDTGSGSVPAQDEENVGQKDALSQQADYDDEDMDQEDDEDIDDEVSNDSASDNEEVQNAGQ